MHHQPQDVILFVQADQDRSQQGALSEVEGPLGFPINETAAMFLSLIGKQFLQIDDR
jgi:hypothetical protein